MASIIPLQRRGPYCYSDDGRDPVAPVYRRATRQPEDEALLNELTKPQERRITHAPDTYEDGEAAPSIRSGYRQQRTRRKERRGWQAVALLLLGMAIMVMLYCIGVHLWVLLMNTFYDPGYYTQAAHRDLVIITDTHGTQFQVQAFVDAQNHVALLVVPTGDTAHAHMIVGLLLSNIDDPQHQATLSVSTNGTTVTVVAQGPLVADWFTMHQQRQEWSADISQQ